MGDLSSNVKAVNIVSPLISFIYRILFLVIALAIGTYYFDFSFSMFDISWIKPRYIAFLVGSIIITFSQIEYPDEELDVDIVSWKSMMSTTFMFTLFILAYLFISRMDRLDISYSYIILLGFYSFIFFYIMSSDFRNYLSEFTGTSGIALTEYLVVLFPVFMTLGVLINVFFPEYVSIYTDISFLVSLAVIYYNSRMSDVAHYLRGNNSLLPGYVWLSIPCMAFFYSISHLYLYNTIPVWIVSTIILVAISCQSIVYLYFSNWEEKEENNKTHKELKLEIFGFIKHLREEEDIKIDVLTDESGKIINLESIENQLERKKDEIDEDVYNKFKNKIEKYNKST
jgi:hypothetical protein